MTGLFLCKKQSKETLPVYEGLIGNLQGFYSRKINIQYRLVYQVYAEPITVDGVEYHGTVKIIRIWTHW